MKLSGISALLVILLIIGVIGANGQQGQKKNKGNNANGQQRPSEQKNKFIKNNKNNANKNRQEKPLKKGKHFVEQDIPGVGKVRGRVIKSEWNGKNILQFFDIPYGKPPVGALRFKAAQPMGPWKNVLKAEKPHLSCPSVQDILNYDDKEAKGIEVEDCLTLTVNTKNLTRKAPVMVYIHGDFLYDGNTLEAAPGYLLEEDVVLVSIRYRLGPFGFLSTMTEDIPGNAAVTDVILALQWIQKHIESFGGDRGRVTLFGQVAGAAMINVLTMSPKVTEELFHRVIYQSASALTPSFITDNPLPMSREIAKIAGCKHVNKLDMLNKCLRSLNTTQMLAAFSIHGSNKSMQGVDSSGAAQFVVGGPSGILPQFPAKLLTSGNFRAYPTMGGSVRNGGTFILRDIYIDNFNETIIDDQMDALGYIKHIILQTNGADPTDAWRKYAEEEVFTAAQMKNGTFYDLIPGLIDLCSTIAFKNPLLLAMQGNAKKLPNSTYLYSFDYEGEVNRYNTHEDFAGEMPFDLGTSLTDDNLYLFPWPRYMLLNSYRDVKIAKRMVALWTSFAATGKPVAPNTPEWPAMTDDSGPYLKIDKTMQIAENFIDEFTAAITDAKRGFNLVNEDFFDSLVEINANGDIENAEEEEETPDQQMSEGRGNIVLIAGRGQYIQNSYK